MVKETDFTRMLDSVVTLKLKVVDEFVNKFVDRIGNIGNPEKLIGKPYESWTPRDIQLLWSVYGNSEPNVLSKFIAGKEYEKVLKLEKEVI